MELVRWLLLLLEMAFEFDFLEIMIDDYEGWLECGETILDWFDAPSEI